MIWSYEKAGSGFPRLDRGSANHHQGNGGGGEEAPDVRLDLGIEKDDFKERESVGFYCSFKGIPDMIQAMEGPTMIWQGAVSREAASTRFSLELTERSFNL